LLLLDDRCPRQIPAQRIVQILEARLVGCEEDERIAIEARGAAARLEDLLRRQLGAIAALPGIRVSGNGAELAALPPSLVYGCSGESTTRPTPRSSGTSPSLSGSGCTRAKSPLLRRSARIRAASSAATLSGSRLSSSARSSASFVTVGWVEYQTRAPSW